MKKVLLSLITGIGLISSSMHAQCSISNPSFETWERDSVESFFGGNKSYYQRPKDWTGFASLFIGAFTGLKPGIYRSDDAKSGSYAIELRADPLTEDSIQSGGDLMALLPCNSNPAQLKGYVSTQGFDDEDSAMVAVFVMNAQQDTVGEGFITLPPSNGGWTEFSCPIEYKNKEGIMVSIMFLYMPEDVAQFKSVKIDDLALSSVSSVNDQQVHGKLAVYPNPFMDQITLQNVKDGDLVKIYDMAGVEVKSLLIENGNKNIPLTELESGIYLVEYKMDGAVARTKIVKD